jgi:uroporphyrinogen decarboxylase
MNVRERFCAIMDFEPIDRTLLWEIGYWAGTVRRWYGEGLPCRHGLPESLPDGQVARAEAYASDATEEGKNFRRALDVHEYIGLDDGMQRIPVNNYFYPKFEPQMLEDHGEWVVARDENGMIIRERKDRTTVPVFVDGPVHNWQEWEELKAERLQPTLAGRLPANWADLVNVYRGREYPLVAATNQGFYWVVRNLLGDERVLYAFHDDPALIRDMMNYLCDFLIAIYDQVLDDVEADAAIVNEDVCYKNGPLISPEMVREFMLPNYQKLTACFRDHGVKTVILDTDGDCWKLIPIFIEGGITGMWPFEANAGMNVVEVRDAFPTLQIMGGIDKVQLASGREAIERELQAKLVPPMLGHGGYVPMVDHAVPPDVSLADFSYYRQRLAELVGGV